MRKCMSCVTRSVSSIWHTGPCNTAEMSANWFKITGPVLKWAKSYLSDRSQAVVLKDEEGETATSKVVRLLRGVPQGSVLGPILFTLFTTPLGDICRQHDQDFHLYANDTQLYASFITSSEESRDSCMTKLIHVLLKSVHGCLQICLSWMRTNWKSCLLQPTSNCLNFFHKLDLVWNLMEQKLYTWVLYETWDIKWTVSSRMMPTSIRSAALLSCTYETSLKYDD